MAAPPELERFCAAEFPRLVRMLDLLTGDVHVAEELAQEALVRTASHWGRVQQLDAPGAWARRVARNLATSRWRRVQAGRRADARIGPDPTVHHDADVAERDAVREARRRTPAGAARPHARHQGGPPMTDDLTTLPRDAGREPPSTSMSMPSTPAADVAPSFAAPPSALLPSRCWVSWASA